MVHTCAHTYTKQFVRRMQFDYSCRRDIFTKFALDAITECRLYNGISLIRCYPCDSCFITQRSQ